jgi:hypothetical protein
VEPVRVDEVDAEHVLPVGDPLHPLHRGVHEDAAEGLAEDALAAELVRRGAGQLHRDVLGGQVSRPDDRVEVVDADHVEVLVVAERIALDPDHLSQPLLVEQVAGEEEAALAAPVVDLAVVGVAVELGQRRPEVEADAGAVLADVEEEVGQPRT